MDTNNNAKQYKKMTETAVPRLVVSLAVPTIISMLVTAVYNTADTFFVSRLGTSASGAVSIVFSLMAIIQAVGFTLGMGSGSMISRLLGQQKNDEATAVASSGFFSGIAIGILLAAIGSLMTDRLMLMFGATQTILPYAVSYARYIILGAPVMIGSFIMNNILRSQGKAKFAMLGIGAGGIINIGLDPLLIFVFKLGTAGAALATLISQCISFVILLSFYIKGTSMVRLKITRMSKDIMLYLKIIKAGLPSFTRQGLASISTIFLNLGVRGYGDAAIAAMGIVGKIFMMIFSVMIGIGQGMQPVVGFNYGAKKYKRVKSAMYFTIILGAAVMAVLGLPTFIFARQLIGRFTKDDAEVIRIGAAALRAQCAALPLVPICTVCNMTLQMTGRSWSATFLACLRQGIFFIPLILILPRIFGIGGVEFTQPIADVLASLLSIPFGIAFLKSMQTTEKTA